MEQIMDYILGACLKAKLVAFKPLHQKKLCVLLGIHTFILDFPV